jgi:hypothetical protein
VDEYNEEYSRDIEPMRGGHADDYYYQMAAFIRRYKGVRPRPKPSAPKTIRLDRGFGQWQSVRPEYLDDLGDAAHRNHPGWGGKTYVDDSGRNDFDRMKVARDSKNLYFYVRTRAAITAPEGSDWMLLLIDVDANPKTGWHGYDFIVNRARRGDSAGILERNVGGGWKWRPVAEVPFRREGSEMHLEIPRKALGMETGHPLRFDFKWADGAPRDDEITDFIDRGDVAPNGRFNYRYEE